GTGLLRGPVPRRPRGVRRPRPEGAPVVGPGPAGEALRPVPGRERAAAGRLALAPRAGAGGLLRLRPGADGLAAAALPGPRPARRAAAAGLGRDSRRRPVLHAAVRARGRGRRLRGPGGGRLTPGH